MVRLWCVYGASTGFKPIKGNSLLCNLLPLVWRREDKIHRIYFEKALALNINQLYFAHLPIFTHFWPITVPISSRYASVVMC